MAETAPGAGPRPGRRAVRTLAGARVVSVAGSHAAQIALAYTIFEETGSAAWVSAALLASAAATGVVGPLSGWVGDRFDRRRVMIASELAAGAGWLALLAVDGPGPLVALALAATVAGAPFRAASAAVIPGLAGEADLTWANGVVAGSYHLALVVGPIVGGALVAAAGADVVFAVNTGSYLASAALLRRLPRPASEAARADRPGGGVLDGFRLVGRDPSLRRLVTVTVVAFAAFGVTLVADLPLAERFGAGSVGYGLLTSLWGLGAVAGSWATTRRLRPSTEATQLTVGSAAMALCLGSTAVIPAFAPIVLAGTIGGVGSGLTFAPWFTMVQRCTADAHRSRVFAAAEACEQCAFIAGMLVAGPLVDAVGPRPTYLLPGALLAFGTAVAARLRRTEPAPGATTDAWRRRAWSSRSSAGSNRR